MEQREQLEKFVIEQLSSVEKYGFAKPIVNRENLSTTIDWFHEGIALEVKLDWRDFNIFVLLVRLEDGKLPTGYYVSNGKKCRLYLQRVIKNRGWTVDQAVLGKISPGAHRRKREYSTAELKERIENYRKVLMSCLDQLVAEKDLIFES